jgi:hypothetical protein
MIHGVNLAPAESPGYLTTRNAAQQADPWRPYDWDRWSTDGGAEREQRDGWVVLEPGEAAWVMILKRIDQEGYEPGPETYALNVMDAGPSSPEATYELRLTEGIWASAAPQGQDWVRVDRSQSSLALALRNVSSERREFRVSIDLGTTGSADQPSPEAIAGATGFACLRPMELIGPQFVRRGGSDTAPWGADDRQADGYRWPESGPGLSQIAAYTYQLAAQSGAPLVWFNLPIDHARDASTIADAVAALQVGRESVGGTASGFVTWGNELFNWIFPQTHRLAHLLAEGGQLADPTMAIADWYADRLVDLWRELQGQDLLELQGQELGLEVVAEWTIAQPFYLRRILDRCESATDGEFVPALAVNLYFGDGEGAASVHDVEQLDAFLDSELARLETMLAEARDIAEEQGVELHAYEGNHHLWSSEFRPKSEATVAVFREAFANPKWFAGWAARLAALAEAYGVGLFNWHTAARPLIDLPGGPGFPPTFIAFAAEFFPGDPASPVRALLEPPTIDPEPKPEPDAIKAQAIVGLVAAIETTPGLVAKLLGLAAGLEQLGGEPEFVAQLRGFAAYAQAIRGEGSG